MLTLFPKEFAKALKTNTASSALLVVGFAKAVSATHLARGDAYGDHQQGAGHKCRYVALWPCYFFPGRKSFTSKPLHSRSNRATVALLLGYLALLLGHPAHPIETFAQTEPERLDSTTVNTYLPLAPWILQSSSPCHRLPKRFGSQPEKTARRPVLELHRRGPANVWRAGGQRPACRNGRSAAHVTLRRETGQIKRSRPNCPGE